MRNRKRIGIVMAGVAALALAVVAWQLAPQAKTSVLLVTLDTTRADRLGCYGYARAETPVLDRLAREGLRYTRAYCQTPLTLPSHATLLTGRLPPEHGLRDNGRGRLAGTTPTLPKVLQQRGYRTAAFLASFVLDRRFGLAQGFEVYDDRMSPAPRGHNIFNRENRGDVVCERALDWLGRNARKAYRQ